MGARLLAFRRPRSWLGSWSLSILELLQHLDGLPDAAEAGLTAQHFECFKQGRRVFSPADSDTNGLEHLPCLNFELLRTATQGRFETRMAEAGFRQDFAGREQHGKRHGLVSLLGNE